MLRLAPRGFHYAFEPLPAMCTKLKEKYANCNRVAVRELALSNASGKTAFHYNVDHPAYSGIRRRDYPSPDDRIELIEASTERLDAVIPKNHSGRLCEGRC